MLGTHVPVQLNFVTKSVYKKKLSIEWPHAADQTDLECPIKSIDFAEFLSEPEKQVTILSERPTATIWLLAEWIAVAQAVVSCGNEIFIVFYPIFVTRWEFAGECP